MGIEAAQRAYDRQTPEEDPAYDRDLEDFCDDVGEMADKVGDAVLAETMIDIWEIWRDKRTRAVDGGILLDFNTFDLLKREFDKLQEFAIQEFAADYDHDLGG